MKIHQRSLEAILFVQAFKAFVTGEEDNYMNLLPIMSYQFPEIQTVLLHKRISQLINFLKKAKEVVSVLPDPDNHVPTKLKNIDSFLSRAYLEEWQRNYKTVNQMTALADKHQEKANYDSAISQYKQSLAIMPTEHAHVHLANLYLITKQPQLFRNHIRQAAKFGRDSSLLPVYQDIFKKIQKRHKPYELYLCAKVIMQFGSKEIPVFLAYFREAVKRKEKIDEKIIADFPQSFQKTICKGIILRNQQAVQYFLRAEKQITDRLSYPNSLKHIQSPQSKFFDRIDLFYLYLSRACAASFLYSDDRNYYLQKGLSYKPNSYELLKQTLLLFTADPLLTSSTAEQFSVLIQALNSLQSGIKYNEEKVLDCQMIEVCCDIFAEIQPRDNIITFVNQTVTLYSKQHQVYLLAAKINLQYDNLSEAEQHCSEGFKLNPNSAEGHVIKGNIEIKKKEFSKAKSCFKKSLQINKKCFSALFSLAALYYSQKRYNSCIQLLQQAKQAEHTDIQLRRLYQLLVKAYSRLNQYDKAQEQVMGLIQTAEMKQISGEFAYSFAEVKFNKGQFNEALKYYKQATKVCPKHYLSHYKTILTQLIQNPSASGEQLSEMLENARVLVNSQKTDAQYLTLYGYLLIKSKKFDQAVDVLFQSIDRNEQSCYAYYHLGRLFKEQKEVIKEQVMNRLGQKVQQLSLPAKYYANSFSFLAAGSHEQFLYNFDMLFKHHKDKINTTKKGKQQFQKMFKRIIGNFHYLNALYPNTDDLLLITAMLYRAINQDRTVQACMQRMLSKYRPNKQSLSNVLFEFYTLNYHYHKLDNYFPFILEFIFEEMLEHYPWELMTFRDNLGESLNKFRENRAVNTSITNYLNKIASIVEGLDKMSNKFLQQMNAFNDEQEASLNVNQLFLKHIESNLRPAKAYSTYSNIGLGQGQTQINKSKGMQILAQQMKKYKDQLKQSEGSKAQLLKRVTNLLVMTFAFDSLWPFIHFVQDKSLKANLLDDFTKTIQQLLDTQAIGLIQQKLLRFISIIIEHYSAHQEQQPPTSVSHPLFSNLDDELQSTIFSSQRNSSSSPFSLQLPKTISHCRHFQYTARRPYKPSSKQSFNSSIIHLPSQISTRTQSSTVRSSIFHQEFDENDFNY